jgi:transposase-like protein
MSNRKTYSREYKIGAIQMIEQKGMTTREASVAV